MIKSFLKAMYFRISPRFLHIRKDIRVPMRWHGSQYGGFFLEESRIDRDSIVYSVGIGKDMSFDFSLNQKFGCKVFCFDPTPESIDWFKKQKRGKDFMFSDYGISDQAGNMSFHLPKNEDHVSGSILRNSLVSEQRVIQVKMKTLRDAMEEHGHSHIDVLKIDIEGAEYDVVADLLQSSIQVRQILVEIHDRLFDRGYLKSQRMIGQLRKAGFELFGISKSFEELSFVNKTFE